jgi:Lon protease-like protein
VSAFGYRKPADLPQTIPLFPLEGAVLYPRGVLALNIFEPRYLNMIDDALGGDRLIGMIQPATGEEAETVPHLADVGTVGRITTFSETEDGRYLVTLTGVTRFTLEHELKPGTPYRQAVVTYDSFAGDFAPSSDRGIDRAALMQSLKTYAALHGFNVDWDSVEEAPTETVINVAAQICPFDSAAKQALLETVSLSERARALVALLEWDVASDDSDGRPRPMQ